jgi:hypothetical protein
MIQETDMISSQTHPTPPKPPGRVRTITRRFHLKAVGLIVAGLVAGTAIGAGASGKAAVQERLETAQSMAGTLRSDLADAQSHESSLQGQISSLYSEISTLEGERDDLLAQVERLDERERRLDERERRLDERAKDLDRRAKELGGREKAVSAIERNSFDDGLYHVGVDIQPGTYHTDGSDGCYWAKLSSSDTFDIIANNYSAGPQTVVIDSAWFDSQGCGTWVPA